MRTPTTPTRDRERGIVLVIALLTLVLLSLAGGAFIALTGFSEKGMSSEKTISTQALFASDAGIEVAKQQMANYAQNRLDSLLGVWGGTGPVIARPDSFFPRSGLTYSCSSPNVSVATTFTFSDSALTDTSQTFDYRFSSTATGLSGPLGRKVVTCEGQIRVSASRASFADFLMFTDTHLTPNNQDIWFHTSGYFDGRVHTNGELRFAYFPTFEDLVSSVNQRAWYYNNGNAVELNADRNGTIDVPNFYGGFQRGAEPVELPENAFSQQRAALGGDANNTSQVTNREARRFLGLDTIPTSAPPNGIYIPHNGSNITGGIYIQGTANQVLMNISGGKQVYTLKDAGNNTCTITLDRNQNRTTVTGGLNPGTYEGLPRGLIYTEGQISDLRGPERQGQNTQPAIETSNQLSIVAKNDIIIQRDITYENYRNGQNVLSIFSSGGNVRIGTSAPNDLYLDAFVMATADQKVFTVDNYDYGSYRGVVHLRGGVVQNYYGAFGTFGSNMTGYGRDFRYDNRGFIPPYYPVSTQYSVDAPVPQVLAWREE